MIAVAALTVLGLVLLAWTRDGLTFRQFGAWLCGRLCIETDDFINSIEEAERERAALDRALKNRRVQ